MPKLSSMHLLGNSKKNVATNIIILANAFVWYSYAFSFLTATIIEAGLSNDIVQILGVHFLGIFLSVIAGELVSRRTNRRIPFILYWMLAGVFLSLAPLVISYSTFTGIIVLSEIIGVNFGFGLPICLGYFASSTKVSNRGRLSGITFLITGLGAFLISQITGGEIVTTTLILAGWKAAGLIALLFLKPKDRQVEQIKAPSYRRVFWNRAFLLYFIPWLMFLLVNSLTFPVNENHFSQEFVRLSSNIEFVLGGISAVIFGFLADTMGRKRLAVIGFALLGLAHAVLGFTSGSIIGWWFYTAIDGIAWGSFTMLFLFTLWGDLADNKGIERFYAVGIMPYLLSSFLRFSMGSYMANAIVDYAMIFSYAAFFLFLAILPLIYAPETLPEKTMKDRELKNYIEKAKRKVEKSLENEDERNEEKECRNDEAEPEGLEFEVIQEDMEKAEELAEEYY